MLKRIGIIVSLICILSLSNLGLVNAQETIAVSDNSTAVSYPQKIDFHLSAQSGTDITDVRLRYMVQRTGFAEVTSEIFVEFLQSPQVDISWSLAMVKVGGMPPGTVIEYWWIITDSAGHRVNTTPRKVTFDDNRFSWKMISWEDITIFWYQGDSSFAQELVIAAQDATYRLADYTGAHLKEPLSLYIYANSRDLQEGMIFPQEWTGGVAFTRYNTLAIAIAPTNLDWGMKTIAHELTHMIVGQITINPYGDLPVWLEEGLAMYVEGEMEPMFAAIFDKALAENSLISLRSLSSPFSAYADESALSYAESYSAVEFLINSFGQDKMLELLNTFKQGSSYDDALLAVYGHDISGIDTLWRKYLYGGHTTAALSQQISRNNARFPFLETGLGFGIPAFSMSGLAMISTIRGKRR
jgi:hypothetical protein